LISVILIRWIVTYPTFEQPKPAPEETGSGPRLTLYEVYFRRLKKQSSERT